MKKLYNYPAENSLEYLQQIQLPKRIAFAYHVYRIDPLPPNENQLPQNFGSSFSLDQVPRQHEKPGVSLHDREGAGLGGVARLLFSNAIEQQCHIC